MHIQQRGFSLAEWLLILSFAAILTALVVTFIIRTDPANNGKSRTQENSATKSDSKRTYRDDDISFEYPSHLFHDEKIRGMQVFKTSDYVKNGDYITRGYSIGYMLVDYKNYPGDQISSLAGANDCDDVDEKCEKVTSRQGVTFIIGNLRDKNVSHMFGREIQAKVMSDQKRLFVFALGMNKDAESIEQALTDLRDIAKSVRFTSSQTFTRYQSF